MSIIARSTGNAKKTVNNQYDNLKTYKDVRVETREEESLETLSKDRE